MLGESAAAPFGPTLPVSSLHPRKPLSYRWYPVQVRGPRSKKESSLGSGLGEQR